MVDISKEIVEIVNKPGRIGTLGTANKQGQPNVAYFGSPRRLSENRLTADFSEKSLEVL